MRLSQRPWSPLGILRGLAGFLYRQRVWWLVPMVAVVLLVGILLALVRGSPQGPLFYPLF